MVVRISSGQDLRVFLGLDYPLTLLDVYFDEAPLRAPEISQ